MADELLFTRCYNLAIRPVDPTKTESDDLKVQILTKYPLDDVDEVIEKTIPMFCFPERQISKVAAETDMFVFVLTDNMGGKQYAFCRRKQYNRKYPECICILSHYAWFSTFSAILEVLASRKSISPEAVSAFLDSLSSIPLPKPNANFQVKINPKNDVSYLPHEYNFQRPNDTQAIQHHIDYSDLFYFLGEKQLLALFAGLLQERRIIFHSADLGRLSSVVHASISLTYPFTWQHIFIPILPYRLVEYCLAPMPFVIGIHSSLMPFIRKNARSMEQVILVNIDQGQVTYQEKDTRILPDFPLNRLKFSIKKYFNQRSDFDFLPSNSLQHQTTPSKRKFTQETNSAISEAFLIFLASIFGKYHEFFDEKHQFLFEEFKNSQTRPIQIFLDEFSSSQMYEQFIAERSIRLSKGLKIGFQALGKIETEQQNFPITKNFLTQAGKTFEGLKNVTQKSTQWLKSDPLKLLSPKGTPTKIDYKEIPDNRFPKSSSESSFRPGRSDTSSDFSLDEYSGNFDPTFSPSDTEVQYISETSEAEHEELLQPERKDIRPLRMEEIKESSSEELSKSEIKDVVLININEIEHPQKEEQPKQVEQPKEIDNQEELTERRTVQFSRVPTLYNYSRPQSYQTHRRSSSLETPKDGIQDESLQKNKSVSQTPEKPKSQPQAINNTNNPSVNTFSLNLNFGKSQVSKSSANQTPLSRSQSTTVSSNFLSRNKSINSNVKSSSTTSIPSIKNSNSNLNSNIPPIPPPLPNRPISNVNSNQNQNQNPTSTSNLSSNSNSNSNIPPIPPPLPNRPISNVNSSSNQNTNQNLSRTPTKNSNSNPNPNPNVTQSPNRNSNSQNQNQNQNQQSPQKGKTIIQDTNRSIRNFFGDLIN